MNFVGGRQKRIAPNHARLGPAGFALFAALALHLLLCAPQSASARDLSEDPFVAQVAGEWRGSGEYDGSPLELTRSWTLELNGRFLRADMQVSMSNGFSFGALMYWRPIEPNVYDVVWMDGLGRRQSLRATRDPDSGLVSTTYLDELAEEGPEWRTWEFESLGSGAYVERLFKEVGEERQLLTVFSFERGR